MLPIMSADSEPMGWKRSPREVWVVAPHSWAYVWVNIVRTTLKIGAALP